MADVYDISGNYYGDSSANSAPAGTALYADSNGQTFLGYSDGNGNIVANLSAVGQQLGNPLAVAVGTAAAGATGSANGGNVLTTPSAGGATAGVNSGVVSSVASLASAISNVVSPPPKTSLNLGASGLSISSAGSLFSNPLMLALLGVIAFLLFWGFKKKRG